MSHLDDINVTRDVSYSDVARHQRRRDEMAQVDCFYILCILHIAGSAVVRTLTEINVGPTKSLREIWRLLDSS